MDNITLADELEALIAAATKGDLSTAEHHTDGKVYECPVCGDGEVDAADYCNFDSVALGVQFYGIGNEFGAHEKLWRWFTEHRDTILAALRTPAPAPVSGDVVAWNGAKVIGSDIREAIAAEINVGNRYETADRIITALQAQPAQAQGDDDGGLKEQVRPIGETMSGFDVIRERFSRPSTTQPDDLERLLGRITCTAETSARVMRDAKNTGGWWGAENTAKNFDIIAKQTDDLRAALAALQAQPTASTAQPDDVVERVARAIARGCNLNPDAISPKAQENGHQIPEWCFFTSAALEALAAMQQDPVADDVRETLRKIRNCANTRLASDVECMSATIEDSFRHILDLSGAALPTQPQADAAVTVEPVTLNECPPGLFMFDGTLCFKSEYTTTLENPRRYQVDAYCVESGEYFHGGAKSSTERGNLMVEPIDAAAIRAGWQQS